MRKTKAEQQRGGMLHLPANGGKWANKWPRFGWEVRNWQTDTAELIIISGLHLDKRRKKQKARGRPNEARLMRHVIKHDKHRPWISNFSFWFLLRTNEELITATQEDAFTDRVRWPLSLCKNCASFALKIPCLRTSDMIYWGGGPLSCCINPDLSASLSSAPGCILPPAFAAKTWSIIHKTPSLAHAHGPNTNQILIPLRHGMHINGINVRMAL